jgi:hypothetical protein
MRRAALCLALVCVAATETTNAHAQEWVAGGSLELSSGLAGGGSAARATRRARTTLRLGGDLRVDETPDEGWAAGALIELEPHTALGGDVGYLHALGKRWWITAGATAFVAPKTLLGGTAAASYRYPLAKDFQLAVGPSFQVFFLGSDMPDKTPIWQATLRLGVHVDL